MSEEEDDEVTEGIRNFQVGTETDDRLIDSDSEEGLSFFRHMCLISSVSKDDLTTHITVLDTGWTHDSNKPRSTPSLALGPSP